MESNRPHPNASIYHRYWDAFSKEAIVDWVKTDAAKQGGPVPINITRGITNGKVKKWMNGKEDFIYLDHSYFQRGYYNSNFRAIRGGLHLTRMLDRPKDRLAKFGVEIEPWRKSGRNIVVVPPSGSQNHIYGTKYWGEETGKRLRQITDRPILMKLDKEIPMRKFCEDAWAVVTYASVGAVEMALAGIPVFSTENCPSWPICSGPLEKIETPEYPEHRAEWAASLSYAQWNTAEMHLVDWVDYQYMIAEDV